MNHTPRTDTFYADRFKAPDAIDFARQLEIELHAAVICAGVAAKERGEWAAEREDLIEKAALVCDHEADRQCAFEGATRDLGLKATHVAIASVLMAVAQRIRAIGKE